MKKLLCIIMTACFAFGLISAVNASTNEAKITVMGTGAAVGNLVDVRVSLSGNTGIDSLTLNLEYDSSALLIYSVEDTGILTGDYHGYNSEAETFQLCWKEGGEGNGTLAIITFMITEEAKEEKYAVKCNDGNAVIAEGFIAVCDEALGDVNDDGTIDGDDASDISDAVVNESDSMTAVGDVNGDSKVNLLDAILIARYAAGKTGYTINGERETVDSTSVVENDMEEE